MLSWFPAGTRYFGSGGGGHGYRRVEDPRRPADAGGDSGSDGSANLGADDGGVGILSSYFDSEKLGPSSRWRTSLRSRLRCLKILLPSFLQEQDDAAPAKRPHPSAWLDGLRGVAAFFVVCHHASLLWFPWHIHNGWGTSDEDVLLVQWPVLRIVISGFPQVMVFFVVSGYALSYKPLKLARQRHQNPNRPADNAWGDAFASSVFRRHSRLFLPVAVVTFVTALLTRMGAFGGDGWDGVAVASRQPPRPEGPLSAQMDDWWGHLLRLADPFSKDLDRGSNWAYDPNLWTLPVEFDCSLVVFLCLAAFSRLGPRARLLFTFALLPYTLYHFYWQVFLFLSGMFLCDLRFHLEAAAARAAAAGASGTDSGGWTRALLPLPVQLHLQQVPVVPHIFRWRGALLSWQPAAAGWKASSARLRKAAWATSFVLAIWVLSVPEVARGGREAPGYRTLFAVMPGRYARVAPDHFWVVTGAVWLVFTIDRAPFLQALFTHPLPQYLGRVSYSLYLVHGPLLWSLGRRAAAAAIAVTGSDTDLHYALAVLFSACVFWPAAIWMADLVWRGVDTKAVKFGQWVYDRLTRMERPAEAAAAP